MSLAQKRLPTVGAISTSASNISSGTESYQDDFVRESPRPQLRTRLQSISAECPPSPTPSLPQSIGSCESSEWDWDHGENFNVGVSQSNSWDFPSSPKEDADAIDRVGGWSLLVDLHDLVDDASTLLRQGGGRNVLHIPRPPSPVCPFAWPQSPRPVPPAFDAPAHFGDFEPHDATCAECSGATDLGNGLFIPDWWSERSEENECMTPEIAVQRRRPHSCPAPFARDEHLFSSPSHRDLVQSSSTRFQQPDTRSSTPMSSRDCGERLSQRVAVTPPRLSLTSLRRSLSLNGTFSRHKGVFRSPSSTRSPASSQSSYESAHSGVLQSPASSVATEADPFRNAPSPYERPVPGHGSPARGSHSPASMFQPPWSGAMGRWGSSTGMRGAADDALTFGYPSPLTSSNYPLTALSANYSPHTSANREPPSAPASPGIMDFDLDYDPRHIVTHGYCDLPTAAGKHTAVNNLPATSRQDNMLENWTATSASGDIAQRRRRAPADELDLISLAIRKTDAPEDDDSTGASQSVQDEATIDTPSALAPAFPSPALVSHLPPILEPGELHEFTLPTSTLLSPPSSTGTTPPDDVNNLERLAELLSGPEVILLEDVFPAVRRGTSIGRSSPSMSLQRSYSVPSVADAPSIKSARSVKSGKRVQDKEVGKKSLAELDNELFSGLMGDGYHGVRTDRATHHPPASAGFNDQVSPHPQTRPHHHSHQYLQQQPARPPSQRGYSSLPSPPPLSPHRRSDSPFGVLDPHANSFDPSGPRRHSSRYSQLTQTSISSDGLSPTTPASARYPSSQPGWSVENRPSVATVFEGELLDDITLADYDRDYESVRSSSHQDAPHLTAPSPTSRHYSAGDARAHRSSFASSTSGSLKLKPGSGHPFAIKREQSPAGGESKEMLAPPRLPLQSSRSFPSLYEDKKMVTIVPIVQQVALVAAEEDVEEESCPVCCESLKNRLPGEKPHIVPDCGHDLHEECFTTVYGDVPPEGSRKHIGVCGICRKDMRVLSGGHERITKKKNKLAALMGGEGGDPLDLAPGVNGEFSSDDPLESPLPIVPNTGRRVSEPLNVVVPNITIKSEQPSVRRSKQGQQGITCMVTIDVPEAVDRSFYAARSRHDAQGQGSPGLPPSPQSANSFGESSQSVHDAANPFANVLADLRRRVVDYRAQGLDVIGQLKLFDILPVRKGTYAGDYNLYLFEGALVCISEERKSSGFRKMFAGHGNKGGSNAGSGRSVLKVKGLIHHLHVREVKDTSTTTEYTVELSADTDNGVEKFQIVFKDSSSHEMWKSTLRRLVDDANFPKPTRPGSVPSQRATLHSASLPTFDPPDSAESSIQCSGLCPGDLAFQVPIVRHHTPVDLVIVISTTALTHSSSAALPLKQRLIRSSLQFVLACMGPRDRISIVSSESGLNGTVRKTPLLNATRHDSRLKLENFIDGLGLGRLDRDEFEVPGFHDDLDDGVGDVTVGVDAAINVGLDVVLGRKVKNPITGLLLISDANDHPTRAHMDLVNARLDAARVQVHAFGYGKAHNPSPLWVVSNHTRGTYTFVKEWYHLRDALAGVVGGLMSIALTNVKLRFTTQDPFFRVSKVSGATLAVVSSNRKEVDVELDVLRHNECREILVEFELVDPNAPPLSTLSPTSQYSNGDQDEDRRSYHSLQHLSPGPAPHQGLVSPSGSVHSGIHRRPSVHSAFDLLSVNDTYEELQAEVPVVEVDCSFHDPQAGRSAARLTNPVLLTLAVLPQTAPAPTTMGEPSIIRRRMELLTSEMMSRAVMAASRKNFDRAKLTLRETKRIVEKMADDMRSVIKHSPGGSTTRSRREIAIMLAVEGLTATTQDIDMLLDGLEEVNKPMFEIDYRNYAAQQAVILRTQRSWTTRTPTEVHYATPSVRALIQASAEYAMRN